jgi:hypothetical protein
MVEGRFGALFYSAQSAGSKVSERRRGDCGKTMNNY